jgi:antitoxin component of MazEF toxin-antitoxin module
MSDGKEKGERRKEKGERSDVRTMVKKLTRTGNSLALVLDKPLLEQLGIDESTELELSTNGDVLVVTPVRDPRRDKRFRDAAAKVNRKYAGLFRRLSR